MRFNVKDNWKMILVVILISLILGGGAWYFMSRDTRPMIIVHYSDVIKKISDPIYLQQFRDYARNNLSDPIDGLDYMALLQWQSRHLWYPRFDWENSALDKDRREMPIDIVSRLKLGRCGEFSLLYYGLAKANDIQVRLIVDNSLSSGDKPAGDHMWNEVLVNGTWIHVDPTEAVTKIQSKIDPSPAINNPFMYVQKWNKEVNEVWAITEDKTWLVTERYNP